MGHTARVNRLSILIGWVALTFIAIGVSSAAVGSVGDRVSPQPASVLDAAEDVVAFGVDGEGDEPSENPTGSPTSTIIDPEDAATAVPTTTEGSGTGPPATSAPGSTTTTTGGTSGTTTTTSGPSDSTTTTVPGEGTTTTTVADGGTTTTTTTAVTTPTTTSTTTTTVAPTTTTTVPEDQIKRRTIDSKGGWIRIAWTDDWLRLGAAGPRVGFKLEVDVNSGDRIVVRFISLGHVSRIVVDLDHGEAKVEVTERKRDG